MSVATMSELPGKSISDFSREDARALDNEDPLKHLRAEFIVPSKTDLKRKTLTKHLQNEATTDDEEKSIYLCGNSLGLQPKCVAGYINEHLSAWATKGVYGHFTEHEDCAQPPFLHIDDEAAKQMAPIAGAKSDEIAIMETLTANLHLLMSSFYQPTKDKYKIIIEGKAFPSDHYAVESQIRKHGFDSKTAMIMIESSRASSDIVTTSEILSAIDEHASSTALILLPGIQYYTGQYFDIKTITAHAHSKGLLIGWDCAHAIGNVELRLHDWDVDFAAWCNYKYVNAGPGAIAGLFVHERHGQVNMEAEKEGKKAYRPRLCGWWGGDKSIRFVMGNHFVPIPGAAGFQVGNPSALALTALLGSLSIFAKTNMSALRKKSLAITSYLEELLDALLAKPGFSDLFEIITPSNPEERGAQLSVKLKPHLLDGVMKELEEAGVVLDERKPDVIRVAPAPLYNTYTEVYDFVHIFGEALMKANTAKQNGEESILPSGGKEDKGWSKIK